MCIIGFCFPFYAKAVQDEPVIINSIEKNLSSRLNVILSYGWDSIFYQDHWVDIVIRENDENGAVLFSDSYLFHYNEMSPAAPLGGKKTAYFDYKILPDRKYYIKATVKYFKSSELTYSSKDIIIGENINQNSLSGMKPDLEIAPNSIKVYNEDVEKNNFLMLNYIKYSYSNLSEKQITDKWIARTEIFKKSLSGEKIYDYSNSVYVLNNIIGENAFFDVDGKKLFTNGENYVVRITLDSSNVINESNEDNNSATLSFVFNPKSGVNNYSTNNHALPVVSSPNSEFSKKHLGKIFLQVESRGEAWYISPKDGKKYYMADGPTAYNVMRNLGVGISNKDLNKIKTDANFRKKYIGKIFLQVESHGEAYYISPDGRYNYLKDGSAAYNLMRKFGQGITSTDLNKITAGEL